ncbi:MAG: ABC transporter ATP-binding protein [Planctomycetes bacterium]|nr:ABC transporter ATP-binding protein [Planctomycetota bacterium]
MSYLEIKNLRKTFGVGPARTAVLENFSLSVEQGEFVALYGRLGDGKTTVAALIAGLTLPDYGSISLGGKCVSGPGPDRALMSPAYAPLAWLSVRENVIAAIDGVYSSATDRRARAEYYLKTLGLTAVAAKKPGELGEPLRRRLALARALAVNPDVLLLDDPLHGLDDGPREQLSGDLSRLVAEEKKTCLLFTSNVDEALLLADRVVPLARDTRALPVKEYLIDLPRPRKAPRIGALAQLRAAVLGSLSTAAGLT